MVSLVRLAAALAATALLFPVAYASDIIADFDGPVPLERLLSPEELEMEFGPASHLDDEEFESPWEVHNIGARDGFVSKAHPARYDRTHDFSQLEHNPAERVEELMPAHLEPYYDLIIYVSKAPSGPFAQQMFIFERNEARALVATHRWMISTGRERRERYFTTTPPGFFMLDPNRMVPSAYSAQWDGSAMPWAMFWDYSYRERMSGYAIHGIAPHYNRYLGNRASGGCIRLPIEHASALFRRVQSGYRGEVPVFAFDEEGGTTFRDGTVEYGENGEIRTEWGYRVLLIVDTFAG